MNKLPINLNEMPISKVLSIKGNPKVLKHPSKAERYILTKPVWIGGDDLIHVIFISSGSGQLAMDGGVHGINPGTLVLLDAAERMKLTPISTTVVYGCSFFPSLLMENSDAADTSIMSLSSDRLLEPFFAAFDPGLTVWRIQAHKTDTFLGIFSDMIRETESPSGIHDGIMRLRVAELLLRIPETMRSGHEETAESGDDALIREITAYLKANFATKINSDDLARHLCVSRSKMFTVFKNPTGKTIGKYIEELRIGKAADLLAGTSDTVYSVMTAVGYKDMKMFCRRFREYMNSTPSEYRKRASGRETKSQEL